ncbi:MAG: HEAT repeat domain-containing protein [Planctomycetota bacterium]
MKIKNLINSAITLVILVCNSCSSLEKDLTRLEAVDSKRRHKAVISLANRFSDKNITSSNYDKIISVLSKTATEDANYYVKATALSLLVENAPQHSTSVILKCFEDSNSIVREEAVKSAEVLKDVTFTEALTKALLKDSAVSVRRLCPNALASIALSDSRLIQEVKKILQQALEKEEIEAVKFAIKDSLTKLP